MDGNIESLEAGVQTESLLSKGWHAFMKCTWLIHGTVEEVVWKNVQNCEAHNSRCSA